tara:strand:+ start:47378 stop:47917 length:540 start_codon:yes stop_codon:yes gene_type:complete
MHTYKHQDLEVVGFICSNLEELDVPRLFTAVVKSKSAERIISDYETRPGCIIAKQYELDESDLVKVVSGPMQNRHAFYVPENSVQAEYITHAKMATKFAAFAEKERLRGDIYFRQGNKSLASEHYERAAIASEEAEDYARLILCDVDKTYKDLLIKDVRDSGKDDAYIELVRREVLEVS